MKNIRKYFLVFLSVAVAVFACLACGGKSQNHTHTYASAWSFDEEYHWHAATCEHTGKESDKTVHALAVSESLPATCTESGYTVYACVCGYTYREELSPTEHVFSQNVWTYDSLSHWRVALCGHDVKGDEQPHRFTDGNKCVCGYEYEEMDAENFTFERSGNGYVLTGFSTAAQNSEEIRLPDTVNNLPVVGVAERAFANNENLKSVILPSGVLTLGREAFNGCTALMSVSIGAGLLQIGETAFGGCTSLVQIVLPDSLTTVAAYAFEGCASLTSVQLPAALSALGNQAFARTGLRSVSVPGKIAQLSDNLFYGCASLETVSLPYGLESIGTQTFARCTSLTRVSLPATVTYIGMNAFKGSGLQEITVPGSVTRIASYAFADCASLTSATVSANITYTAGSWFSGCSSLQSLTLPFVGNNASYLEAIDTAFGFIFGTTPPVQADKFTAVQQGANTYYIPATLTHVTVLGGTVAANAFNGCTSLTEITLAKGVLERAGAFNGCNAEIERLS